MENKYTALITTSAQLDIDEVMEVYDNQKQGSGMNFFDSFDELAANLELYPFLYAKKYGSVRKASIPKFPYHLFYSIDEQQNRVVVLAVLHKHTSEAKIKHRLKGR